METVILVCFSAYTLLLFVVMWLSSRRGAGNDTFFRGQRRSPWPVVAYGMIGASLSGVTFMSVPGGVYAGQFSYLPLVFGYLIGYAVIAFLLLPLYYRLNLTSIYSYLGQRFGTASEKTGSLFFLLSRLLGSALRMYLVVFVLYEFVFRGWGIPFWVPAAVFIAIILLYTFRGGIKTVVWTDTLQTTFLLAAAVATLVALLHETGDTLPQLIGRSADRGLTRVFETDPAAPKYYWKQILSGVFITITMTGLDQDMMQKNLTCKTLRDAQKNMLTMSLLLVVVNVLFLFLGAALFSYAAETGFPLPLNESGVVVGDKVFPAVAFHLGTFTAVVFVLGMVAAGYSSADGTLTALTTAFCYNFLNFGRDEAAPSSSADPAAAERRRLRTRRRVHVGFALVYLLVIIVFRPFHNQSLIDTLFDVAGFTYGPLLGLFAFGLFTRRRASDRWVPVVAVAAPVASYLLKLYMPVWTGYRFGFEILLVNGLLTFVGLLAIGGRRSSPHPPREDCPVANHRKSAQL